MVGNRTLGGREKQKKEGEGEKFKEGEVYGSG